MNKKTITVCICGAVGSTNINDYLIALSQFYNVNVAITKNAKEFIKPDLIRKYCNNVYDELFDDGSKVNHVFLGHECDHFIILPATANMIGKIANGIADDLISSAALNIKSKIIFCPNMNPYMWANEIVKDNVEYLKEKGHVFLNKKKLSYQVCENAFVEIESALPTFKELLEFLKYIDTSIDI
ncbi:MAG: flavoprotein [Paraclostridium sp.]